MIRIKAIDAENVFDVCELTTNQNGVGTIMEEYLCCNAISIAEAKYYPEMHPSAIYNNNVLIGFFMYKRTENQPDTATLCRFMIDYKFQQRGLGRKAFEHILKGLKIQGVRKVVLMIDNANEIAKKLYVSFGFRFTGIVENGEYYYGLEL
ncbi:GNAT family N-acetyltransferase [Hungatella hathewayi]|uniref:GNAT family N-acetyltransferase n=1 Tax=Hungatella hathewayi TaxID=154046 RepID=UPI0035636C07